MPTFTVPPELDWQSAQGRLQQGRVSDPAQDRLYAAPDVLPPTGSAYGPAQGEVSALPFGDIADPVSQAAFFLAPYLQRGMGALGQMRAAQPMPTMGGLLRAQRGSTGVPGGAAPLPPEVPAGAPLTPQIYVRPEEVTFNEAMWGNPPYNSVKGELLRGTPVTDPATQLPEDLYHVTTNYPAVRASGGLRHMPPGTTGLGKGMSRSHQGVSLTTSPETAAMIERELKRAGEVGRGGEPYETWLPRVVAEDERLAGVPPGTLAGVQDDMLKDYAWRRETFPHESPTEQAWENLRYYWQRRGHEVPLENPIIFGDAAQFGAIPAEHIRTLTVPRSQIPPEAFMRKDPIGGGHLNEVMVHGDIPLKLLLALLMGGHLPAWMAPPTPRPEGQ
jgi:hypothetical protein